ncbi:RNA polymerase factor sigma-54 [Desulfofalx alkaliphila]|uniref:RNA polymerase factor sigma-54 n=1 Tax=Desulfofalx alkaliphila TaxID=105483 RepID=UPI0004E0E5E7|nr:RNA polymerase factor sigma-54 [Desulfofalx alkaliphila]
MRLDLGLNLEQSQKLIITPELRQAIAVLQMASFELTQFVEQQLQENPLLEKAEDRLEQAAEDPGEDRYDIDWQEYFNDSSDLGYSGDRGHSGNEYGFESFVTKAPSLSEHLNFQLTISRCPKEIVPLVEYLIGNVNSQGYLKTSLEDAARVLNVPPAQVEKALKVLHSMEPAGVGARTLEECLLLQVRYLGLDNPLIEKLIKDHLNDLAQGKLNKIANRLGVTVKEIQRLADQLRTLDPKPGRCFSSDDDIRYIVPDVVVERVDKEYIILVNDVTTPRLRISNSYRAVMRQVGNSLKGDEKKYIEAKMNAAVWLIRSIEQRRMTIYKVANALVELQREFLDHGVKHLKPLNLKDVADRVGLHESTVSRATSNKYMQTPQGVFSMKYFFSTAISYRGGSQISSESTKKLLREIIAGEDPKKPYSDQRISDLLAKQGIKISRRTVTKYRDELAIPAAGQRKRY